MKKMKLCKHDIEELRQLYILKEKIKKGLTTSAESDIIQVEERGQAYEKCNEKVS